MNRSRTAIATLLVASPTSDQRRQSSSEARPHLLNLTVEADDRLLLTVADAARRLEISRSLFYELLAAGEIESIHVGRLRRVPVQALAEYIARQRPESGEAAV